ncbi:MAG: hypothetical protein HY664_03295 [Chloroflexi bacterium]|nr:hypothetical protein [Chloroflexota bacterium]
MRHSRLRNSLGPDFAESRFGVPCGNSLPCRGFGGGLDANKRGETPFGRRAMIRFLYRLASVLEERA